MPKLGRGGVRPRGPDSPKVRRSHCASLPRLGHSDCSPPSSERSFSFAKSFPADHFISPYHKTWYVSRLFKLPSNVPRYTYVLYFSLKGVGRFQQVLLAISFCTRLGISQASVSILQQIDFLFLKQLSSMSSPEHRAGKRPSKSRWCLDFLVLWQ